MRKLSKKELMSAILFALSLTITLILYEFKISAVLTLIAVIATVSVLLMFSRYVMRERTAVVDALTNLHPYLNSAYLSITTILMTLTIVQMFSNNLDLWVPLTLGGMVLSKGVGLIYAS
ncbi:hypothetical protein H6763_03810 [Candidatus Nomurabacteria bacterium]|uniref:Uncharacterized protein n=1 Tax=Candidatus Dojkabacteria bacterium TaxID=2099670 RepID=A0A955I184_9BACT|nr:hypothetical protein [Candidatus Dojkabacteria bacterium]MCB9789610.1 hypothetical protein [Candidatus Nomurabacteria bacterium]MCB9803930.1 hypothetical protein [Candidatus Nomurabacteria bacterium]